MRAMINDINFKGLTPAHKAVLNATSNDIDLIKLFINDLEDKNPTDANGRTLLHIAAFEGDKDVVGLLYDTLDQGIHIY